MDLPDAETVPPISIARADRETERERDRAHLTESGVRKRMGNADTELAQPQSITSKRMGCIVGQEVRGYMIEASPTTF